MVSHLCVMKRFFIILLLFGTFIIPKIQAQAAAPVDITASITTAMQNQALNDKTSALAGIVSSNKDVTLNDTSKTSLFNALDTVFKARLAAYTAATTNDDKYAIVSSLTSLFGDVTTYGLLPTEQDRTVGNMWQACDIEKEIFGFNISSTFTDLDAILNRAAAKTGTFDQSIHTAFLDLTDKIFQSRTKDQALYKTNLARLKSVLAKESVTAPETNTIKLLDDAGRTKAADYLRIVTIEQSIFAIQENTDYLDQISKLAALFTDNQSKTFTPFTQKICNDLLQSLIDKRASQTPEYLVTNDIIKKLIDLITQAQTSPLIDTTAQQTGLTTTKTTLNFEQNIVLANVLTTDTDTTKGTQLTKLSSVFSATPRPTVLTVSQALCNFVLNNHYDNRSLESSANLNTLLTILNTAKNSPLLVTERKTNVSNVMIPEVTRNIAALNLTARIQTIINLTDNTQRIKDLHTLKTDLGTQTLSDSVKNLIFTALKKAFESRNITTPTLKELCALKSLFSLTWSTFIIESPSGELARWITALNDEIKTLLRKDPAPPMNPENEPDVFAYLKEQYDNQANWATLTLLLDLKALLVKWAPKFTVTTPINYKNTINNTWIPAINQKIGEFLNQTPPPDMRPEDEPGVFAYLKAQYDNQANWATLAKLFDLKSLLVKWAPKFTVTTPTDYKTTINNTWIPEIDKAIGIFLKKTPPPPMRPEDEPGVFAYLKAQYDNQANWATLTLLFDLKALLVKWAPKFTVTTPEDYKATINTTWVPEIDKAIGVLLKQPPAKDIPPGKEKDVRDWLKTQFDARDKTSLTSLYDVQKLLQDYLPKFTTQTYKTEINGWLITVNGDIKALMLANPPPPIPEGKEKEVHDWLKTQFDARIKTSLTSLYDIQKLLNNYLPKFTTQAYIDDINNWLTTINGEITTLLKQPPAKDIPPGKEKEVRDWLEAQFNARISTSLTSLYDVQKLLTDYLSKFTTQAYKDDINNWLTTIGGEITTLLKQPPAKDIPPGKEKEVHDWLKAQFDARDKTNLTSLYDIQKLLQDYLPKFKPENGTTAPAKTAITGYKADITNWLTTVNGDIKALMLTDPPQNIPEGKEKEVRDWLKTQFDARVKTSLTSLYDVQKLLNNYLPKFTTQAYIDDINNWLTTINGEITTLLKQPPAKDIPPGKEKEVRDWLETQFNARVATSLTSLYDVQKLLTDYLPKFTTQTYKDDINNWLTTIGGEITTLLKQPPAKDIPPGKEKEVHDWLKTQFDARDKTNLTSLYDVQKLLQDYLPKFKPENGTTAAAKTAITGYKADITNWLTTVNGEIKALMLTDPPQAIPDGKEKEVRDWLEAQFKARVKTSLTSLYDVQKLLNNYLPKFTTQVYKDDINGWLTTINSEITTLLKQPPAKDIPPGKEKEVRDWLETQFNARISTSLTSLYDVQKLLTDYLPKFTTPTYKTDINGWLGTISGEITMLLQTSPPPDIPPGKEKDVYTWLKAQYEARVKTELTSLYNIQKLLTDYLPKFKPENGKTTADKTLITGYKTNINGWLTIINGEITTLLKQSPPQNIPPDKEKEVYDWLKAQFDTCDKTKLAKLYEIEKLLQDYRPKFTTPEYSGGIDNLISQVKVLINNLLKTGSDIPQALEGTIYAELQTKFDTRDRQNLTALTDLRTLLTMWGQKFKTVDYKTTINTVWIPQINLDIQALINDPRNFTAPLDPAIEASIWAYLTQLYNDRQKKTQDELVQVRALFVQWADSNKLNTKNTETLRDTYIPTIDTMMFIKRIDEAMKNPDLTTKLDALQPIVQEASDKKFLTQVQTYFFDTLKYLFSARLNQSYNTYMKLNALFTLSKTSPLLSPAQQTALIPYLNALELEIGLLAILQNVDFRTQLMALFNLVSKFQGVQSLDTRIQNLFYTVFQQVLANRQQEYAQSDININTLSALLLRLRNSILISADKKAQTSRYEDIVTVEQFIADALKLSPYSAQLTNLTQAMSMSAAMTFDFITHNLFFDVLERIYNGRTAGSAGDVDILKTLLQDSLKSQLLNFSQKTIVKSWLEGLGITVALTEIERQLASVLSTNKSIEEKLNAFISFVTNLSTLTNKDDQASLIAALQQIIGLCDLQNPDIIKLLIQLLEKIVANKILPATYVNANILPLIQQLKETLKNLATPGSTIQTTIPVPTKNAIEQIAKLAPDYASICTYLSAFIDKSKGKQLDKATQDAFFNLINTIYGKRNELDITTLQLFYNLLLKTKGSPVLNNDQHTKVDAMIKVIADLIKQKTGISVPAGLKPIPGLPAPTILTWPPTTLTPPTPGPSPKPGPTPGPSPEPEPGPAPTPSPAPVPTKGALDEVVKLAPDYARICDYLSAFIDQAKGKSIDKATQDMFFLIVNTIFGYRNQLDSITLMKFYNLLLKTKGSPVLNSDQHKKIDAMVKPIADLIKSKTGTTVPTGSKPIPGLPAPRNTTWPPDPSEPRPPTLLPPSIQTIFETIETETTPVNKVTQLTTLIEILKTTKNLTPAQRAEITKRIQTIIKTIPATDLEAQNKLITITKTIIESPGLEPSGRTKITETITIITKVVTISKLPVDKQIEEISKAKTPKAKLEEVSTLLDALKDKNLTEEEKRKISKKIKEIIETIPADDQEAQEVLIRIKNKIKTSNAISSDLKDDIEISITTITQKGERKKKEINDAIDDVDGATTPKDKATKLKKLIDLLKDSSLTPEEKARIKDKIKKATKDIIDTIDKNDPDSADILSTIEKSIKGSTIIDKATRDSLTNQIETIIKSVPKTPAQALPANIKNLIDDIDLESTPINKVKKLADLMDALKNANLTEEQRKQISKKIQDIIKTIPATDLDAQAELVKIKDKIINSPAIASSLKDQIKETITKVTKPTTITKLSVDKQIDEINKAKTPKEKLEEISLLLAALENDKTLSEEDKRKISKKIKEVIDSIPANDSAAQAVLARIKDKINASSIISSDLKGQIATSITNATQKATPPTTLTDQQIFEQKLNAINSASNFVDKLNKLKELLNWAKDKTLTGDQKSKVAQASQQVASSINVKDAHAAGWLAQLKALIASMAFLDDVTRNQLTQKVDDLIKKTSPPTPTTLTDQQIFEQKLRAISSAGNFLDKLRKLQELLDWAKDKTLTGDQKSKLAQASQQVASSINVNDPNAAGWLAQLKALFASMAFLDETTRNELTKKVEDLIKKTTPSSTLTDQQIFEQKLRAISSARGFLDKLHKLQELLAWVKGKSLTDDQKSKIAQATQQVAASINKKDPYAASWLAQLKALINAMNFLDQATRTQLIRHVDAIIQSTVKPETPSLKGTLEERLASIKAETTFIAKVLALGELFKWAEHKSFTTKEQKLFMSAFSAMLHTAKKEDLPAFGELRKVEHEYFAKAQLMDKTQKSTASKTITDAQKLLVK